MDYTDKKFTLDNGKIYIVIEQVDYDDKTYLYIVNREDEEDNKFVEIINDTLSPIDPDLFKDKLLPIFIEKLKK